MEGLGTYRLPHGSLPEAPTELDRQSGLSAARAKAERNLGAVALLPSVALSPPRSCTFCEMLEVLNSNTWRPGSGELAAQAALRSVERELFVRAAAAGLESTQLEDAEVDALVSVVDKYREVSRALVDDTEASRACMLTELHSREVLVLWVAFCLIHASVSRCEPVLAKFGVPLRWQDLQHLVLTDKEATSAALAVAAYLRRGGFSQVTDGSEAFSLRDNGKATFELALLFAQSNEELKKRLEQEDELAKERMNKHWKKVQEKQARAKKLRDEIGDLRQKISKSNQYTLHVHSLHGEVAIKTNQLGEAEKPLPPVVQPLPKDKDAALRWLFFLHMPKKFSQVGRMSFLAQQMLLPRPWGKSSSRIIVSGLKTHLKQHYNNCHNDARYHSSSISAPDPKGAVWLYSMAEVPKAEKMRPGHIDNYSSPCESAMACGTLTP